MQRTWSYGRIFLATLTIVGALLIVYATYLARSTLVTVFIAILISLAMKAPVDFLAKHGMPRRAAMVLVLVVLLALIPLVIALLIPPMVDEIPVLVSTLVDQYERIVAAPEQIQVANPIVRQIINQVVEQAKAVNVITYLRDNAETIATTVVGFASTIVSSAFIFVFVVTIAFLWLADAPRVREWVVRLASPADRPRARSIWDDIERQLGAYLRGLLVLVFLVGILAGLGYLVMGLRFGTVLALLMGLLQIVPIPGVAPLFGAILVFTLTINQGIAIALIAVIWTLVIMNAVNFFLVPRILGQAMGVSAMTILIGLLVFGSILGPVGTLLAIPLLAIIQIIIDQIVTARDARYYHRVAAQATDGGAHAAADVSKELSDLRALLMSPEPLHPDDRVNAVAQLDDALRRLEPMQAAKTTESAGSIPAQPDDRLAPSS
ncbi:MAG: AI-2E family transporter [Anaerolineae bacterium]